jgi:hypothetical protein
LTGKLGRPREFLSTSTFCALKLEQFLDPVVTPPPIILYAYLYNYLYDENVALKSFAVSDVAEDEKRRVALTRAVHSFYSAIERAGQYMMTR